MWSSVIIFLAPLFTSATGACYKQEEKYYPELGCKPGPPGADDCPSSYVCGERSQDQCQYEGQLYNTGHSLDLTADCLANCYCTTSPLNNKTAFSCVSIECPEIFGEPPPTNCYRTYELDQCCRVDEVCVDPEDQKARPVCHYKGLIFEVGQRFYVDEDCKQCICKPGYNGSFVEPFCRDVICNLELLYGFYMLEGCVPVYYDEDECCPIGWRCPEPRDTLAPINVNNETAQKDDKLSCRFGDVEMQVGDWLSPSDEWPSTHCECRVPPHPVCIHKHPAGSKGTRSKPAPYTQKKIHFY